MYTVLAILLVALALWSLWGYFGSRVEQAEYVVLEKKVGYEVREYPAHLVAQTTVTGSYEESLRQGFRIVAGYIFGGNTKKQNIAMTAPVVVSGQEKSASSERIAMTAPVVATAQGDSQVISFGMPRSYTLETLPTPTDSRVQIVEVPAKKYAAMGFSFIRSDERIKKAEEALGAALMRDGIKTQGSFSYAGYNGPGTPPWMIRNEVLIEINN